METTKIELTNRQGLKIVGQLNRQETPVGLAIIMHGMGGFKEQPHILAIAESFTAAGFTTLNFDATHSLGESGGSFENVTVTSFYDDLQDIVDWAKTQFWYQEPFALAGHSLGAMAAALYAEAFPNHVKMLAPVSTVVSGELTIAACQQVNPDELDEWEKTGWFTEESKAKPGVIKRLPWSHMQDRLRYDLLPQAGRLNMPVILIVGQEDTVTPPEHLQILYEEISGPKEIQVIDKAPHTFRTPEQLAMLKFLLKEWISKYCA